jgi:hypothetical protein
MPEGSNQEVTMFMAANGFVHSADIPVPFALAVYSIMRNDATEGDWDILDQQDKQLSYAWIRSIYISNQFPFTQDEANWWSKELVQ